MLLCERRLFATAATTAQMMIKVLTPMTGLQHFQFNAQDLQSDRAEIYLNMVSDSEPWCIQSLSQVQPLTCLACFVQHLTMSKTAYSCNL